MYGTQKYYLIGSNNPLLRQEAEEVTDFSGIEGLVNDMKVLLSEQKKAAVGLAAPQIGVSKRVFIAKMGREIKEFVNPKIINSKWYSLSWEECLSMLELTNLKVRRYSITVEYQNMYGEQRTEKYRGLNSRIVQHEIDHLNGILIIRD
ncbi:MAG TPA: peptide deformylase [Candidatus Nanoarchaeia archaeon]|nr:peptide deformylase [Candidatus Nanoarchaeia archaeon]